MKSFWKDHYICFWNTICITFPILKRMELTSIYCSLTTHLKLFQLIEIVIFTFLLKTIFWTPKQFFFFIIIDSLWKLAIPSIRSFITRVSLNFYIDYISSSLNRRTLVKLLGFFRWLIVDSNDVAEELVHLMTELQAAEDAGEKVYIVMHMSSGNQACQYSWSHEFNKIVAR